MNYVMKQLLGERTDFVLEQSQRMTLSKTRMANKRKFQEKLITILVSQFTNVMTAPDGVCIQQDDQPWVDRLTRDNDEEFDD